MEPPRERTADRRRADRAAAVRRPARDGGTEALLLTAGTLALVTVLLRIAFVDRSDYAGHFLAGAGATTMLLAFVAAFTRSLQPLGVVLLCLIAVILGCGTEATIFREAAYDWCDFAVQSSGAVLAGTAFLAGAGRRTDLAFGLGFAAFVGGCFFAFA